MKIKNNKSKYKLSFNAIVLGYLLTPTFDKTERTKEQALFFGQRLLDIAQDMKDKNKEFALLSILYINAQVMKNYELERKSLEVLSRYPNKKLVESLLAKEYNMLKNHLDDLAGIMQPLTFILGIKDMMNGFDELDDFMCKW